jgi:hypothetical protein
MNVGRGNAPESCLAIAAKEQAGSRLESSRAATDAVQIPMAKILNNYNVSY